LLCKGIKNQFSVQYLLLGIFAHEIVIATLLRLLYFTFEASKQIEDYYGRHLNIPVNRGCGVSQWGFYSCPLGGHYLPGLEPYYDILDFHVEDAMLYFRARKR
jgi:hypothetical protein